MTPARLARFFCAEGANYRVNKALRACVTFAIQNLLNDPPYGRLDLISCRNVMIYLEPDMQERMLALFHFALRPGGLLFLGESEGTGELQDAFETVDREWRGIGTIPGSGYELRPEFSAYDAGRKFNVNIAKAVEDPECIAGLVLKGIRKPGECPQFGKKCRPQSPLGAPMVSGEGACAAYYHFSQTMQDVAP